MLTMLLLVAGMAGSCAQGTASIFERNAHARHLAAALQTHFARAVEAANRAAMANSDQVSRQAASDAERAREQVERAARELAPLLRGLGYAEESKVLDEFRGKFAAYEVLDRSILELAVQHTNLKATRLSFGPVMQAADAFEQALNELVQASDAGAWQVRALGLEAVVAVREIQVLQAPHIAEADDAPMTRMEEAMARSEAAARRALTELSSLVAPARLAPVNAALDRFMELNAQLIALSRRNTNVRSLGLTLGQKRAVVSSCEESLRALNEALTQRVARPSR